MVYITYLIRPTRKKGGWIFCHHIENVIAKASQGNMGLPNPLNF